MEKLSKIDKQILSLEKGLKSSVTPENMKKEMKEALDKLKEQKKEQEKKPAPQPKANPKAKKERKARSDKKPKDQKSKYTAKKEGEGTEPTCKELLERYNARREAYKKSKKKTQPVFKKISGHVADAAAQAIHNVSVKTIEKDPKKAIDKFKQLTEATEDYLKKFKSILGEDYKASASDAEIGQLEDLIQKLEKKYIKK